VTLAVPTRTDDPLTFARGLLTQPGSPTAARIEHEICPDLSCGPAVVPQSEASRSCQPRLWSGLDSLRVEQTVLNRWAAGGAATVDQTQLINCGAKAVAGFETVYPGAFPTPVRLGNNI